MSYQEDQLIEIYNLIEKEGLREKFDTQILKMDDQKKHKFKTVCERWDYALYRIKGGVSKEKY
tara:strand:+ start:293 stop:481 length:189 start_codon:yes stop_codon:yes gene_type:complete